MATAFRSGVVWAVGTEGVSCRSNTVGPSCRTFRDYIPLTVTCTYTSFVISYLSYDKDGTDTIDTVDSDNTVRLLGVRQYKYHCRR